MSINHPLSYLSVLATAFMLAACNITNMVDGAELPEEIIDPKSFKTELGALGLYNNTVSTFTRSYGVMRLSPTIPSSILASSYLLIASALTDELEAQPGSLGFSGTNDFSKADIRIIEDKTTGTISGPYFQLHTIRGVSQDGRLALKRYYPDGPSDLTGHLFAFQAASEMLLAELYCSGIPLSRVNDDGTYTLSRGMTTTEVFENALRLLDSADISIQDSARIKYFVAALRGRVLLALARYAEAAEAVQEVPDNFLYNLNYSASTKKFVVTNSGLKYGDRQGGNGLPFGSLTDPRTTLPSLTNDIAPLPFASGLEARLIEAEYRLSKRDSRWLDDLNSLRTTCTDASSCLPIAPPGIGGVAGLSPLSDPATSLHLTAQDSAKVRLDLLFEERAYWLFLRGHRQGDMRRLIRNYGRPQETVYPIGLWGTQGMAMFGNDVNLPIPNAESDKNPHFNGCENREA